MYVLSDVKNVSGCTDVSCRKEKIIRVRKVEKAYPAGLKQSSAKLLESHGVSINPGAIAKAVP